jgi:outer membrane protein OmpA-like peptidoglycan-associated protein
MSLGRLFCLLMLPVLAIAPVVGGTRTRAAAPEVAGVPEIPRVVAEALSAVHFAAGATAIRPRDMKILDAHARWLHGEPTRVLLIEGHTDGPEDSAFSRGVGEERAKSAKAYLLSRGAVADRITIVSRGGGRPACGEKTAICRAANRRATFSTTVRP